MCGVLGYFSETKHVTYEDAARSLESIRHRGPDGRGIVFSNDKSAVIGHARLSMVDPEGGHEQAG